MKNKQKTKEKLRFLRKTRFQKSILCFFGITLKKTTVDT